MTRRSDLDRFTVTKDWLVPGVFFAFFVRWCVAAYPYSGYKKPPMFGDFEAQRHWQEITVHTPVAKWYHNTTQNDLEYWGLDYPPLTAYHSYLMGLVADWLDPESVRLFASRGYEDYAHKIFMRWTVFLCDIYFYASAVLSLCIDAERVKPKEVKNEFKRTDIATTLFLLYPGLILIDHGHFQYNCVSLGFFLWSTFFIIDIENNVLAAIFFVLALNYKQMELYHALPIFFYLLRKCFIGAPNKGKWIYIVSNINQLAVAVISCFLIIWVPFLGSRENIFQVIHRLFPLKRGVFEDKVSNVWCLINVFVKLKSIFSNEQMARICMAATTLAAFPSCVDLFFRINKKKFVLSLINVSLAFFLFSFQVHEKSILLVAIPVAIHMADDPFMCFWFLLVSGFSMLPLLLKDGLLIPFIVTNIIYISFFSISIKLGNSQAGVFIFYRTNSIQTEEQTDNKPNSVLVLLCRLTFFFSLLGMVILTTASVIMPPPPKYPDLFSLSISIYSFLHFLMFFMYFYRQQFAIPTVLPVVTSKVQKLKHK